MIDDPTQGFTGMNTQEGRNYEADRTKRLHRRLLVGYALSIVLWLVCAIPLARLSSDQGGGAAVTAIYLVAGLVVALAIRAVYTRITRRPFWSPWLFAIAAIFAIMSYAIQSAGDPPFRPGGANQATTQQG